MIRNKADCPPLPQSGRPGCCLDLGVVAGRGQGQGQSGLHRSVTGGVAANGIGARNSAELAVKLRNADPKAKYDYELVVLDDECKPNVAVQVATKAGADRWSCAAARSCSAAAIAAVETYNRLGLPMVVWGAVLPDITYRAKYPEVHRVNGTMINQNEVAAKLMTGLGFKKW